MIENIKILAEDTAEHCNIKYDIEGVRYIAEFIEWAAELEEFDLPYLIDLFGSFFGECLVRNFEGQWAIHEGEVCVKIPNMIIYPFHKVSKQFSNGEQDSIYALFSFIATLKAGGIQLS